MKIIAHRCGDTEYPEETIDAARHALALGADYLEIDLRSTVDRSLVVVHDDNLLRLFGVDKRIEEIGDAEFRMLRYIESDLQRPRFFSEFIELQMSPLLLHIKQGGGNLTSLFELLTLFDYGGRVVFGVATLEDLMQVKNKNSSYSVLAFMRHSDEWKSYLDAGANFIRIWDDWVTSAIVNRIHENGKEVWVMTGEPSVEGVGITNPQRLWELRRMGIDGVLVNNVELAIEVLKKT